MGSSPNRLLEELGEAAARFNRQVNGHSHDCCPVCRRLMRDLITAILDVTNWQPESMDRQVDELRDQVTRMKQQMADQALLRPMSSPVEPIREAEPESGFFGPPPVVRDDD